MTEISVSAARPEQEVAKAAAIGERRAPAVHRTGADAGASGPYRFLACVAVLAGATAAADLAVAAGVSGGMIHLAVVLLGWWSRKARDVAALAAVASGLVLVGFAFRFEDTGPQAAVVDRVIALLAIWAVAAALIAAKRRETALRREQRTLAERIREQAAELAVTQTHVELADRSRSDFFAKVGHELRTPLNAIIGFSEIIKDEIFGPVGSDRYREYMHDINESGRHLLALIDDMMDIAKLEVGNIVLEEDSVEVAELIRACVSDRAGQAARGRVALKTEIPADLAPLRADRRILRQILDNLISNAVKFTAPGGTVTVSAWAGGDDGYALQVADSGIGMAPEDIPVALAPFGQVESGVRRHHEGRGLGLPLAKALVELHAGSFDLQSEPGVGTTVTLRFPAERIAAVPKVA